MASLSKLDKTFWKFLNQNKMFTQNLNLIYRSLKFLKTCFHLKFQSV